MKKIFIPVIYNQNLSENSLKELSKKLPNRISIFYSIQYKKIAEKTRDKINKKVVQFSQVLGCSSPEISKNSEGILIFTDGKFHSIQIVSEAKIPVFLFNGRTFSKIEKSEVENFSKHKKISYLKFLNSDKVGIFVSTKPGQENLKKALNIKKSLKKKSYLFISNQFDKTETENFKIKSIVNTACPRLDLDSSIINISDLKHLQ